MRLRQVALSFHVLLSCCRRFTLQQAKEAISKEVPVHPEDVHLSLNKKSLISTDPTATLQGLGVCSGDLLWVLTGPAGPTPPKPQHSSMPAATHPQNTAQPPDPHPDKRARNDAGGAHNMEVDGAMDMDWHGTSCGEAPPVEASHLARLLAAHNPPPQYAAHQPLLLAVQAAMLEVGFHYEPQSPNQHEANAPAAAAGTQQGAQPSSAQGPMFSNGVCRMSFRWGAPGSEAPAAGAAGAAVPKCLLTAATMGRFLVVHAKTLATAGSHPDKPSKHSNGSTLTLHLDSHAAVDVARLQQDGVAGTPGIFKDLRSLWVHLKDDLALWALAGAHQAANIPPPVGLLTLPFEIKDQILSKLEVRDLSILACVCMELRQLADADHHWKPAFLREFPNASIQERSMAERLGYKHGYIFQLRARKQRQQRAMAQSHLRPGYGPPMPGPLFPSRGPTYPPNIIGGDYDRLPGGPSYGSMMPAMPGIWGPPLPGEGSPLQMGPSMGGSGLRGPHGGLLGPGRGFMGGSARGEAGRHFFG
ncbi:hypothetical protein DUNSADRAFT_5903 [Dunaliella salina]|uniref:F-box domain-containing protein n=1 Tax=Dunaliella salina TaxID=3046 RepID=A0ABQ7GPC9_DUNSA|nr:hypothetical protein DUNSADRAFT_5903 [Dunaliella salina]|eukprot:KAF5836456.1 hypothetical protein DUNSADRAFT_5903 [Dunaliella salina]